LAPTAHEHDVDDDGADVGRHDVTAHAENHVIRARAE
jgi:hypothetical protein